MPTGARKNLDEAELSALRTAVDTFQAEAGKKMVQSPEVQKIIRIVEGFLRRRRLICYGGTAINNILPADAQFYDKETELPDYDFFSPRAYEDAIELADIYARAGYTQVEAKSGVHHGTYKVFVNYLPVADVTHLAPSLFRALGEDSDMRTVDGIRYAPPNYLRMAMYLELSRPRGDISRWEKVIKRLALLNKYFPLKASTCKPSQFMRAFEGNEKGEHTIFKVVRDSIADQGLVFFGGYATSLYSKHMTKARQKLLKSVPDFDVLAEDPKVAAQTIRSKLEAAGVADVVIRKKPGVGEIIAAHWEVRIGDEIVCFIYEPLACHSFNAVKIAGKTLKIATIDTMLSFYLAFLYAKRAYYDHARLICMAEYLFAVQAKNRFSQRGLLRRWTPNCYGTQKTLTDMRVAKSEAFERLKSKRGGREWNEWFLNYVPSGASGRNPPSGRLQRTSRRRRTSPPTSAKTVRGYTSRAGPVDSSPGSGRSSEPRSRSSEPRSRSSGRRTRRRRDRSA